jgi:hypothetical protein
MHLAPDWLIKLAGKPAPHETPVALTELDQPPSILRATEYLLTRAPEAVQGQGGDNTTFKVACRVKDFGISESTCLDLLIAHWNETKAHPNWDFDELQTKVHNAYRHGSGAVGKATAEADFVPVELTGPASVDLANAPKHSKLFYVPFASAVTRALEATAEPLIKGLLDCQAMSVIYGDSNSGKTFLAIDIASHLAAGLRWNGRKSKQGLVVYVAAEGGRGVYKRLEAWRRKHGIDPGSVKLALVPCPVDLRSLQGDASALVALVKGAEAEWGEPVVLVVIDTLSRAMAGGDENSPVDMGLLVRNCDRVRDALGCHLMLIHHTGKNKAAGARGHSLLRAATDTEIEVDNRTFAAKKQRDIEPIKDLRFDLEVVRLGADSDGDPITSCTVSLRTASEFEKLTLNEKEQVVFDALKSKIEDEAEEKGVPAAQYYFANAFFCEIFLQNLQVALKGKRQASDAMMQAMQEKGWIKRVERGQWVIT